MVIVMPIALFASAFVLPLYTANFDISNLLTVVSLLFAILLGFFIATATANYLNFQNNLGTEGASLIMLFNFGRLVQPKAEKKLAEAIDQYVIATLDFSLSEYVPKTEQEFTALLEVVDALKPRNDAAMVALDHLHEEKSNLMRSRSAIALTAPRVTGSVHWVVIALLAAALAFLLFELRTGGLVLNIVSGILAAVLYLTLLVLYEVDGNKFLEEQLAYSDVQGIFRSIGKPIYYPEVAIANNIVRTPAATYRVGIYTDYPRSTAKVIKTVSAD